MGRDLKQEVMESLLRAAADLGQGFYARAHTCTARAYLSPRHKIILFGD